MIDDIVELIFQEARRRPGNDIHTKTAIVSAQAAVRIRHILRNLTNQKRSPLNHETQTRHPSRPSFQ